MIRTANQTSKAWVVVLGLGGAATSGLWAQAELVVDLSPGFEQRVQFDVREVVEFDDAIYFHWSYFQTGDLWRFSESSGLERVPGVRSVASLRVWKEALYFAGDGPDGNWRLFRISSGTQAEPSSLIGSGGEVEHATAQHLYWTNPDELGFWVSMGEAGSERQFETGLRLSEARVASPERFFFFTEEGALWRSDGTSEGTSEILALGTDANPDLLAWWNGRIYFRERSSGARLVSVGTEGDLRVEASFPEGAGVRNTEFLTTPQHLYFVADDGMATRVYRVAQEQGSAQFVALDGAGVYSGSNTLHRGVGGIYVVRSDDIWWVEDIVGGQTTQLTPPASFDPLASFSWARTDPDGNLFIARGRGETHRVLRAEGAEPLEVVWDGLFWARVVFASEAGAYVNVTSEGFGPELWLLRPAGPEQLTEYSEARSTDYRDLATFAGHLCFRAEVDGEYGHKTYVTNGTALGTIRLDEVIDGGVGVCVGSGDRGYMIVSRSGQPREVWTTDGTENGTFFVSEGEGPLTPIEDGVTFVRDGQLWATDGTLGGTGRLTRDSPGVIQLEEALLLVRGAQLFSFANGAESPLDLGWGEIYDLYGTYDGMLLFGADIGQGVRVWITDGTEAGTRAVTDHDPYLACCGLAQPLVGAGTRVVIKQYQRGARWLDLETGEVGELLASEDLGVSPSLGEWVSGRDSVFFSARDAELGHGPWFSDLTAEGTRRLHDVRPGWPDEWTLLVTSVGGRAYFELPSMHGRELFTSDGTEAGLRLAADITPGPEGTDFGWWRAVDESTGTLYFTAHTEEHGMELWKYHGQILHYDGFERGDATAWSVVVP